MVFIYSSFSNYSFDVKFDNNSYIEPPGRSSISEASPLYVGTQMLLLGGLDRSLDIESSIRKHPPS